jgi:BirA family biotin operon repressor/biotin-[acetyl-CoA-carboxylase] ligase
LTRYDGLDEAALARLTGAPRVSIHASVPSAMDVAHDLAAAGAPNGTLVVADEQTAGRGRSGRAWHSPPGAGIWLAMVLRPAEPPAGGALAIRTGLAVEEALAVAAPALMPDLKWPNDIVLDHRKLGGILCEARWSSERLGWITVGIGLNVHGPVPEVLADIALAIADVDPEATRLGILEQLVPRVTALHGLPPTLSDRERSEFLLALWMPEGEDAVVGLEPDGALLVRRADGSLDRHTSPA